MGAGGTGGAVPLVLDTDIGTDVDDALALALAARHPGIDLRAVTTVSGDARRRARIARYLLALAGREDVTVAAGASYDRVGDGPAPEMGHEGQGLELDGVTGIADASAVDVLLAETASVPGCVVATVGMPTNVAEALEQDGSLASRIGLLAVMGGVFAPVRFLDLDVPPTRDHNLNVDPPSSLRALSAGLPTLYVPCDVTFGAWLERRHVNALRTGDDLCRVLAEQIDVWTAIVRKSSGGRLPDDKAALLHDPLTVACLVERSFVTVERKPVTVAQVGRAVRTFVDPLAGHDAEVVTSVDAPAFADWWLTTVRGA